ncbi:MAG: aromatic amino acid DMT transporter YddG, partial [Deferribacterales bacterium]|nr:aromatic amino acid DMT transporter YddG [Deferribacterales bacterium]
MVNSVHKGNLIGIGALILWGTLVALIKSVSEAFGVAGGTALIYTIGAIAGFILNGIPKISLMPKKYLFLAGSVFVLYEIVFSQAIAVSESSVQTLEVGMINYLWPCLTVLFSIWINGVKMRPIVWPGVIITVCGLYLCAAANSELNFFNFINNLAASPVPYILGLAAAVTWGLYSNLSVRYSSGANGVPLFFAAVAVFLWIKF